MLECKGELEFGLALGEMEFGIPAMDTFLF